MEPKFIKIGMIILAPAHITGVNLRAVGHYNDGSNAVLVYTSGDDEPWSFQVGSPEAKAFIAWLNEHTDTLLDPNLHEARKQSTD